MITPIKLWYFSRPHTIIGTFFAVTALYSISLVYADISPTTALIYLYTLVTCGLANIAIVGFNQCMDEEVDKINKPFLPLPAKLITRKEARGIVISCNVLATLLAFWQGPYLLAVVVISLVCGHVYSLPIIRYGKFFIVFETFFVFFIRGIVTNLGIYLHFDDRFVGNGAIPDEIWILTMFFVIYAIGIAWLKDTPDVEGDVKVQIKTLPFYLGPKRVMHIGLYILGLAYFSTALAALVIINDFRASLLAVFHAGAFMAIVKFAKFNTDFNKETFARFYQKVWYFFYLEYIFFILAFALAVMVAKFV